MTVFTQFEHEENQRIDKERKEAIELLREFHEDESWAVDSEFVGKVEAFLKRVDDAT